MRKIIIFGAKGMLGSELVRVFSNDKNYSVLALDKDEIDITKKDEVLELVEREAPAIMINAAAYNAVDRAEESEDEFELAKQLNAYAPENLAKAAKKTGAVFAQYVTDYLFDGKQGEYLETDKPNPISNYGQSKALGEQKVQQVGGKFYLIRISKLFGIPGKSPHAKKSFFGIMLENAKNQSELKVINDERSCFTYVPDLARATKELVEKQYPFGIYHIVNEGPVTWFEGAKKLFELAKNKQINIRAVDADEFHRAAKRASSTVLVNTKFPKLRNYEEALKEWLEDMQEKVKKG